MATFYQTFSSEAPSPKLYTGVVAKGKAVALSKFKILLHKSAFMHLCFSMLILLEVLFTSTLFYVSTKSIYTPISLSLLFLTLSSYALITFYQKNRKLDAIEAIASEYLRYCSLHLSKKIEDREKLHLAIAESTRALAEALHTQELFYLTIHPFKFSKNHIISHFLYFHYNDILFLQEKLLDISFDQHGIIIEDSACSLDFHSSLSKSYATLSGCYKMPHGKHLEKAYNFSNFSRKAELASQLTKYHTLAIEELKIVCDLSDGENWTHLELASLYSLFGDTEKEMEQYEILIDKVSADKEILYKLGILYFKHHKTSKGLKVYKDLRKIDALFAKNLLSHYNSL